MEYKLQEYCRVCKNKNLVRVIELGEQYLTGVFPDNPDQKISKGPLNLVKCYGKNSCGLVQLEHTFNHNEMYGENYGYRSGLNKSMVSHLQSKVRKIESFVKLNNDDTIIDIGSNDGTTLKLYKNQKMNLVGIDPTAYKFKKLYTSNILLISDFFTKKIFNVYLKNKKAKVVTSISMFYDLPDPLKFASDISEILDNDGIWVLEQSYIIEMLKTNSYDTICHEHLEYYSIHDLKYIAEKCELKIVDIEFNDINGGSFSAVLAKKNSKYLQYENLDKLLKSEIDFGIKSLEIYREFQQRIDKAKNDIISTLKKYKSDNIPVACLGASTKGNVMLQYCQIGKDLIELVGEVNEEKFGKVTPGTNIPIVDQKILLNSKYNHFLVLPWHFKNFFLENKLLSGKNLIFALPNIEVIKVD